MTTNPTPQIFFAQHCACEEGRDFALRFPTMADAWEACSRPDWLLWALSKKGYADEKTIRLFACWCVRHTPLHGGRVTWDLLTDERSRNVVEVAERYAHGEASIQELRAARVKAAYAGRAYEPISRACLSASRWFGLYDVRDATDAADDAIPTLSTGDDATIFARRAQAEQLKKMVPNPFREPAPCPKTS